MTEPLPELALSVRQPWAWAIIHGGKVIENRSLGAIRSGNMMPGRICVHAASGMSQDEYRYGHWRLARHGVACPRPEALPRSAIIGTVEVLEIITASDSEWFGGEAGLLLADPEPVDPIPATGALGYFRWQKSGALARAKPWMLKFDAPGGDLETPSLLPDMEPSYRVPPRKPWKGK